MTSAKNTRRLLILRHGKSDWSAEIPSDFERRLNARGRRAAATMGAYLAANCPAPSLVMCSAAQRAVETWEIMAKQWPQAPEAILDRDLYLAETAFLMTRLRKIEDHNNVVCLVGHHPGFDGLAIHLASDQADPRVRQMESKFPTAALADLQFDGSWSDIAGGLCTLLKFVRPKELG